MGLVKKLININGEKENEGDRKITDIKRSRKEL